MNKMVKHNRINKKCGRVFFAGTFLLVLLSLAGCGVKLPNLNDEQMDQVGEYAANLLLQYDSNNRMRLMSEEEMRQEEARRAAWAVQYPTKEKTESPHETQKPVEQDPKDPVEAQPVQYGNLEDLYEFPSGVTIRYTGYAVYDRYPDDLGGFDAAEGKEILALQFVLQNNTDATQSIDFLNRGIIYRITVNSDYAKSQMLTMLDNDLGTYQGKIASGNSQELVLLTEIDKGVEISSLTMKGENAAIESTIRLK